MDTVWIFMILKCYLFIEITTICNAETVISALHHERLIYIERELIQLVEKVLKDGNAEDAPDENTPRIRRFIDTVNEENTEAYNELPIYTHHPLNVLRIVHRLVNVWPQYTKNIKALSSCTSVISSTIDNLLGQITKDWLAKIAYSISKTKQLYNIELNSIIDGDVNGHITSRKLGLDEYQILARAAHQKEDYAEAIEWYEALLDAHRKSGVKFNTTKLLNTLSSCYIKNNRIQDATEAIQAVLEVDPNNARALSNEVYVAQLGTARSESGTPTAEKRDYKYEQLCSGNLKKPDTVQRKLKCYNKETGVFLRSKVEVVNRRPLVEIYHNVIDDHSLDELVNDSAKRLYGVIVDENGYTSDSFRAVYRANRFYTRLVTRPLFYATQQAKWLNQALLVTNYGIGGGEDPYVHLYQEDTLGLVITRAIIFLNEVKDGGDFLLPMTETKITPKKGSVVIFKQTDKYGKIRKKTSVFAECPLIYGSKWVAWATFTEEPEKAPSRWSLWR
ncbi:unnamed protein product [Owenia fusiformis]|uniref:Uncharacterized protein n=1 Tax=Owenia fusiformis TaxID=6347 RepID=A0A8J1ULY0_OWEFU|nr:unnamed protein product [Owenia fusiformis]